MSGLLLLLLDMVLPAGAGDLTQSQVWIVLLTQVR